MLHVNYSCRYKVATTISTVSMSLRYKAATTISTVSMSLRLRYRKLNECLNSDIWTCWTNSECDCVEPLCRITRVDRHKTATTISSVWMSTARYRQVEPMSQQWYHRISTNVSTEISWTVCNVSTATITNKLNWTVVSAVKGMIWVSLRQRLCWLLLCNFLRHCCLRWLLLCSFLRCCCCEIFCDVVELLHIIMAWYFGLFPVSLSSMATMEMTVVVQLLTVVVQLSATFLNSCSCDYICLQISTTLLNSWSCDTSGPSFESKTMQHSSNSEHWGALNHLTPSPPNSQVLTRQCSY